MGPYTGWALPGRRVLGCEIRRKILGTDDPRGYFGE